MQISKLNLNVGALKKGHFAPTELSAFFELMKRSDLAFYKHIYGAWRLKAWSAKSKTLKTRPISASKGPTKQRTCHS
jgi:hypothetical protein